MAKFEMSKTEELDSYKRILRKSGLFALSGTLFVAIYFLTASSINIVSSSISLTSLVLIGIVIFTWFYVAMIGLWVAFYKVRHRM